MNLSPLPIQKFFSNDGIPLASGRLFVYAAGTTTKINSYTDASGTANTNPIILDFRGECRLWIDPLLTYKLVLAPPGLSDPPTNPIWTVDNITAAPAAIENSAIDTGSGNSVQLSIPTLNGTPVIFTRIIWKSAIQNTDAVTITINGGLAKNLLWQNRASLDAGALQIDGMYEAIYDGSAWQLQGPTLAPEYMLTLDEFTAGVSPANFSFLPLDLRRYYSGGGDYSAAMSDAIAVCGARGGTISMPTGTLSFSQQINLEGKINIILQGQGGNSGGGAPATTMSYTGSATSFIRMGSALGCWVKDCQILYTDAAFAAGDALIRVNNSSGADAQFCGVERCTMGAITGAGCVHIALDGAIIFTARDCLFIFGNPSITGRAAAGANYSNVIQFYNCTWGRSRSTAIVEGGEAWLFSGCTWEGLESGAPGAFANVAGISRGTTFQSCWFGDTTATGTWIQYAGSGLVFSGNYISTLAGANTTAIALSNVDGAVIQGNQFDNFTQAVDFAAAGCSAVNFTNNNLNTVTNVFTNLANVSPSSFVFNPNSPAVGSLTGIATIATDGYSYDCNGVLTVRGTSSVTVGVPLVVVYAKAFVSAPRLVTGVIAPPSTNNTADVSAISNTQFTLNLRGGAGSGVVHWIAQGI